MVWTRLRPLFCFGFLFLSSFASLRVFDSDDPLTCVSSKVACDSHRLCLKGEGMYQARLLFSPLPLLYHDIDRVSCCFKCLVEFFEPQSPLTMNSTLLAEFSRDIKMLNHPASKGNLLMSTGRVWKSAHYLLFNRTYYLGQPTQYALAAIHTADKDTWREIQGRTLLFVNTYPKCVAPSIVQQALQRVEHAFNPLARVYYSFQLPCQSSETPNKRQDSSLWYEKIKLLPVGIRSPIALTLSMKNQNSPVRSKLLDCSCARSSSNWNDIIRQYPSLPCSFGSESVIQTDMSEIDPVEVKSMTEIYNRIQTFKFVLSPSDPAELSSCEWEALALGAIPIMNIELQKSAKIRDLFEGLPIHFVQFSSIQQDTLEGLHPRLLTQFSDASQYSLSKLYYPYWLGQFRRQTITGKAPQRVWENIGNLINTRQSNIADCMAVDKRDSTTFSRFGRIGTGVNYQRKLKVKEREFHNNAISPPSSRRGDLKLEFVLPRCCEDGDVEFGWLYQLLSVTSSNTGVSVYYKCPTCLPYSQATHWLKSKYSPFQRSDFEAVKGINLIDDSILASYGTRVFQKPCIDRIHNGKEVSAYLTHIVEHYETLADQTIFLHTVPHSHLHFDLFYRLVAWSERCQNFTNPVDFIHLNVHYKTGPHLWTSCCGCKPWGPGSCRVGTWKYLFHDYPQMGPDYEHAHTYSSAQFAVSRRTLQHWPKSFYERMLSAINGTNDIVGCCHSTTDDKWGGHSLTGQYERMWHIIFGHSKFQAERRSDTSIPAYLRLDCDGDPRCSLGAL